MRCQKLSRLTQQGLVSATARLPRWYLSTLFLTHSKKYILHHDPAHTNMTEKNSKLIFIFTTFSFIVPWYFLYIPFYSIFIVVVAVLSTDCNPLNWFHMTALREKTKKKLTALEHCFSNFSMCTNYLKFSLKCRFCW